MVRLTQILDELILAQAADPAAQPAGGLTEILRGPLPLFVIIGLLFYFVLLQPERKRRQQHAELLASLKKNDRILTHGGIYGTVVNIHGDSGDVTIRIDENSNTRVRITRNSIGQIITEGEEETRDKKA